jgi:tetratricopeptide (TPR) repeat protein
LLQRAKDSRQAGEAHATLAEIYREQGDHALAIRTLQKARDLQPTNLAVRLRIARLREEMGDLAGATSELRKAETEIGGSPQLDAELTRLAPRGAERDEALKRELFLQKR